MSNFVSSMRDSGFPADVNEFLASYPEDGEIVHLSQKGGLFYIAGEKSLILADQAFGPGNLSIETVESSCEFQREAQGRDYPSATYNAKVRVTVFMPNGRTLTREAVNSHTATSKTMGDAIRMAATSAETNARKRALATFGNRLGLCLYNKRFIANLYSSGEQNAAGEVIVRYKQDPYEWMAQDFAVRPQAQQQRQQNNAPAPRGQAGPPRGPAAPQGNTRQPIIVNPRQPVVANARPFVRVSQNQAQPQHQARQNARPRFDDLPPPPDWD